MCSGYYERTAGTWLAFAEATHATRILEQRMREALEFHLEGLREVGEPVPPPTSGAAFVDVAA